MFFFLLLLSKVRARRCLLSGETTELEESVEWLLEHDEDSDIDDPIPQVPRNQSNPNTVAASSGIKKKTKKKQCLVLYVNIYFRLVSFLFFVFVFFFSLSFHIISVFLFLFFNVKKKKVIEEIPPVKVIFTGYFIGQKVVRGIDWKWGNQDENGEGYIIATEKSHPLSQPSGWVSVKWEKNKLENSYRAGDGSLYHDLEVIDDGVYGIACEASKQAEIDILKLIKEESDLREVENKDGGMGDIANAVTKSISTRALIDAIAAATAGLAFLQAGGHELEAPIKVKNNHYSF